MGIFHHWLIPRESNNHKARILHPSGLVLVIIVLLLFQLVLRSAVRSHPSILGIAKDITSERLLALTNAEREKKGLKPLHLDSVLSEAANEKAQYMLSHNYWAHTAPDGTTPWEFFNKAGYRYLYAGENLAKEFEVSDGVVSAWMQSPSHRANILRPEYQDIGFAVVNGELEGEKTTLVVELFGTKQSSSLSGLTEIGPSATTNIPVISMSPQTLGKTESEPHVGLPTLYQSIKFGTMGIGMLFIGILAIDGYVLWRKGVVRISGHNFAHGFFLLFLVGAIWFIGLGSIL